MSHDPRVGSTHLDVVHQGGRGAGGNCFIKDFETFIEMLNDSELEEQNKLCKNIRNFNLELLKDSNKNEDLIKGMYGE